MYDHTAVFPTRTNISAQDLRANEYFEECLIYYVLADLRGKPRRIVSGFGSRPDSGWNLGNMPGLHHDQAGYYMGHFKVVGWVNGKGDSAGELPSRKLPLAVFK